MKRLMFRSICSTLQRDKRMRKNKKMKRGRRCSCLLITIMMQSLSLKLFLMLMLRKLNQIIMWFCKMINFTIQYLNVLSISSSSPRSNLHTVSTMISFPNNNFTFHKNLSINTKLLQRVLDIKQSIFQSVRNKSKSICSIEI